MNLHLKFELNGKTFTLPVAVSEEDLVYLSNSVEAEIEKTGWEKPEYGNMYYYEDALCRVQQMLMNSSSEEQIKILYDHANCYSNVTLAEDFARGDALMRKLRRLAAQKRTSPIDFSENGGYTITYNYMDNCIECGVTGSWMAFGDILFETEEQAQEAITEYRDELIWYFTEMVTKM